jgi:hypothetical protein
MNAEHFDFSRERIGVITRQADFLGEARRALPGATPFQIATIPDAPQILEKQLSGPPSLLIVDGNWQCDPQSWAKVQSLCLDAHDGLSDDETSRLPRSLWAVSRLSGFRLQAGWHACSIVLNYPEGVSPASIGLSRQLGADWVFHRSGAWQNEFARVVLGLRTRRPLSPGRKVPLRVLVAENTVEVFDLLKAVLDDSCAYIRMSLDASDESLYETRSLKAESVVRDFQAGIEIDGQTLCYDAVIVDMALSFRGEAFSVDVKQSGEGRELADRSAEDLCGIVNENLEGLVVVRELRRKAPELPICVYSDYVAHGGFRAVMRRFWGTRVFDSVAVFPKGPDGRRRLRSWLDRQAQRGSQIEKAVSRGFGNAC